MIKQIETVGIIGGGKMGTSLFYYLTKFNFRLIWHNRSDAEKNRQKHQRKLDRVYKNNLINDDQYAFAQKHQQITSELTDLKDCELIIECITENKNLKQQLFEQLFAIVDPKVIIASNSSSLTPWNYTLTREQSSHLIGLHFFFPIETKNLVEFIYTDQNTKESIQQVDAFLTSINKFHLRQSSNNALILNALMLKWQIEAFELSIQNNWSFLEIDQAADTHLFPLGLFSMMDYIGLDLIYASSQQYQSMNYDIPQNARLFNYLEQKIAQQQCGIKHSSGFHTYPKEALNPDQTNSKLIASALVKSFFSIYNWTIENQLCSKDQLNIAMNEYLDTQIEVWLNLL